MSTPLSSSTKRPPISVLLVVFNGEKYKDYLGPAIDSVLTQTFRDFELIIVHDGAPNSATQIIAKAQQRDPRVVVITDKQRTWIPLLNLGWDRARGKYLARMDADDLALPDRFQKQYDYLEQRPDVFLVSGRIEVIDQQNRTVSFSKTSTDSAVIAQRLPEGNILYQPTFMLRNEPEWRYREKALYAEDYDLLLRLLTSGKRIANMPDVLMRYRLWPSSTSLAKRAHQALFTKKIQEFYWQRVKGGRDEYEAFDPQSILSIDVEQSTDEVVLREQIAGTLRANELQRTRKYCRRYFQHHGFSGRVVLSYLASLLGRRLLTLKRRFVAKV